MSGVQQNRPLLKTRFQVKSRARLCDLNVFLVEPLELGEWLAMSTDRPGRRVADPKFSHSPSSRRPFLHGCLALRCCVVLQAQQLTHERLHGA